MFNGLLRRMCILDLLSVIFHRYLLCLFGLWCHLILKFPFWCFCLCWCFDLSIVESVVFKAPTIILLGSICAFIYSSVCVIKLGALMFIVYMFIIVTFLWWIVPFINMKWLSLSLLILVWSLFCQIWVWLLLHAFGLHLLGKYFSHPFTISLCLSLPVRCFFCRQQMVVSLFF
jgi:hypothetical protein